jgi:hypothetical protein
MLRICSSFFLLLLKLAFFDYPNTKPSIIAIQVLFGVFPDPGIHGADLGTDTTALAVIQIKADHGPFLGIHQDAGIGTEQPTLEAVDAVGLTTDRAKSSPVSGVVFFRITGFQDHPGNWNLFPTFAFTHFFLPYPS